MLKKIQSAIDKLASHIGVWAYVAGSVSMSALSGYFASVTDTLAPYAPLSWFAVALFTLLISVCLFAIYAKAKSWIIDNRLRSNLLEKCDSVNPLESDFKQKRINISDLASPIDSSVTGKTFMDCEILGPANVILRATAEGSAQLTSCSLFGVVGCRIKDTTVIPNVIVIQDCRFIRCKIYRLIIFIHSSEVDLVKQKLDGMPWISD